jgi:hypothetical protein
VYQGAQLIRCARNTIEVGIGQRSAAGDRHDVLDSQVGQRVAALGERVGPLTVV